MTIRFGNVNRTSYRGGTLPDCTVASKPQLPRRPPDPTRLPVGSDLEDVCQLRERSHDDDPRRMLVRVGQAVAAPAGAVDPHAHEPRVAGSPRVDVELVADVDGARRLGPEQPARLDEH